MEERAYRYRFYPTEEQKVALSQTFGSCRFVYNYFLNEKQTLWKEKQESLSYHQASKGLGVLKETYPWLKEISSVPLQQSLRHQDKAYQNFFKKNAKYPKFKSKSDNQSAHYMKNAFSWKEGKIVIAKIGVLNIRFSRSFQGIPTSLVLKKDASDRYYISIHVKEEILKKPFTKNMIGLDLGLTSLATDQEGNKIQNPRFLKRSQKKLKTLNQNLSRKEKGSKNRLKAKKELATFHRKIREKREDYLHKQSTKIVNENQVIVLEDLSIKNMQKNKKLSFSIADVSWSRLVQMIKYKAKWYGRDCIQVQTFFPSSKKCSNCGEIKEDLALETRKWTCAICKTEHDRDKNAATNILQEGLKQIPRGARELKPVELV